MRRTKEGLRLARTTNLKNKNLTSLRLEGFDSPRLKRQAVIWFCLAIGDGSDFLGVISKC